jgi:hypothetical protein
MSRQLVSGITVLPVMVTIAMMASWVQSDDPAHPAVRAGKRDYLRRHHGRSGKRTKRPRFKHR